VIHADEDMYLRARQRGLLELTVAHFNLDNRAFSDALDACTYRHTVNGGCAVGRLLPREAAEQVSGSWYTLSIDVAHGRYSDEVKKAVLNLNQTYGERFLSALQKLHDNGYNWDSKGLSPAGYARYLTLVAEINNGRYTS
jgi:hypothetical protein